MVGYDSRKLVCDGQVQRKEKSRNESATNNGKAALACLLAVLNSRFQPSSLPPLPAPLTEHSWLGLLD
jgi:hypothetical protein